MSGVIFRWAGSKHRVLKQLFELLPKGKYRRWIEPFVGGCSVVLEAMRRDLAAEYVLSDALPDIYALLHSLKFDDVEWLKAQLNDFKALAVEEQRSQFLDQRAPYSSSFALHRARRFLILQACSFNGLWRVNRDGGYNVPFGLIHKGKVSKPHLNFETLSEAASLLRSRSTNLLCQDFADTLSQVGEGDLVYADPPYLGTHSSYGAAGFGEAEHSRLAVALLQAKRRGAECWVSGSDCQKTIEMYAGQVFGIEARRSISRKSSTRGVKREVLIRV